MVVILGAIVAVLMLSTVIVVLLHGHHTVPVSTPSMAITVESGYNNQTYDIAIAAISSNNIPLDDGGMMISSITSPLPISQYREGAPWIDGNFTMYYVDENQDSELTAGDRMIIEFAQRNTEPVMIGVVYRPTGGNMASLMIE